MHYSDAKWSDPGTSSKSHIYIYMHKHIEATNSSARALNPTSPTSLW